MHQHNSRFASRPKSAHRPVTTPSGLCQCKGDWAVTTSLPSLNPQHSSHCLSRFRPPQTFRDRPSASRCIPPRLGTTVMPNPPPTSTIASVKDAQSEDPPKKRQRPTLNTGSEVSPAPRLQHQWNRRDATRVARASCHIQGLAQKRQGCAWGAQGSFAFPS